MSKTELLNRTKDNVLKKYNDSFLNKHNYIIIIIVALLSVLPVFYLANYYIPARDDFWYSFMVKDAWSRGLGISGILKAALDTSLYFMESWQGLYSSAFVLALQPEALGIEYGWMGPALLFITLFAGVYMLTRSILSFLDIKEKYLVPYLSVAVYVYFVHCLPGPTQGFFWFNGAANYTFFWGLGAVNAALLLDSYKNSKLKFAHILPVFISFIISGGNHVSAFMNILVCVFFLIYGIVKKHKKTAISLLSLATSVVGFIIVITAPGTQIRGDTFTSQPPLSSVIWTAYRFFVQSDDFFTISLLLFLVMLTPALYKIAGKLPEIKVFHIAAALFVWGVIVCGMTCVPYYAMGYWGESRLYNLIFYTWNTGVIIIYTLVIAYLGRITDWKIIPDEISTFYSAFETVFAAAIIVFIFVYGNFEDHGTGTRAVMDILSGEPQALRQEYLEREEMIKNGETVLPAYTHTDTIVFLADISDNQDHFSVSSFKRYHHMDEAYIVYPPKKNEYKCCSNTDSFFVQ